jgi:hypothetical protein
MASIFGGTYPGAGASISQGFVFGFIAARHACAARPAAAAPVAAAAA